MKKLQIRKKIPTSLQSAEVGIKHILYTSGGLIRLIYSLLPPKRKIYYTYKLSKVKLKNKNPSSGVEERVRKQT